MAHEPGHSRYTDIGDPTSPGFFEDPNLTTSELLQQRFGTPKIPGGTTAGTFNALLSPGARYTDIGDPTSPGFFEDPNLTTEQQLGQKFGLPSSTPTIPGGITVDMAHALLSPGARGAEYDPGDLSEVAAGQTPANPNIPIRADQIRTLIRLGIDPEGILTQLDFQRAMNASFGPAGTVTGQANISRGAPELGRGLFTPSEDTFGPGSGEGLREFAAMLQTMFGEESAQNLIAQLMKLSGFDTGTLATPNLTATTFAR
jgi:hypothetical protein